MEALGLAHVHPGGAGPLDDGVEVVYPEAEVVHPGLLELGRVTERIEGELLVEDDEAPARLAGPPQVHGVLAKAELRVRLLAVDADLQADDVAVEGERADHVRHADVDMGEADDVNANSPLM
jgi:hypothetical protein